MKLFTYTLLAIFSLISFSSFSQYKLVDGKEIKTHKYQTMSKSEEIAQLNRSHDKTTTCAAAVAQAVSLQDCTDIGTAGWLTTGTNVNTTNVGGCTVPGVAEQCAGAAGYSTAGTWIRLNPDPGVQTLDFQFQSGAGAAGNHNDFIQFFQGSCAALTAVSCSQMLQFVMGLLGVFQLHVEGINPAQDVWAYVWDDGGKAINLNWEVIGSGAPPANANCAGASTDDYGCNLGAGPEAWTGPDNNGKTCTGGTWFSNENTVYFSFTASLTNGTIGVTGIDCNDGGTGQAQFGVWNNCGCVGTYTAACFRSCAVGAGTLSLSSMTPGQTYIIAVDGQAGDICDWNFTTTGIILPVQLLDIRAKPTPTGNLISWTTASERDSHHFIVQRSEDGEYYYDVGQVKASGNTSSPTDYSFLDENHPSGTNYYRLIQVDINGALESYIPISVVNEERGIKVVPNPVDDKAVISFGSNYEGATDIKVTDISGKAIQHEQLNAIKGTNSYILNTSDLSSGIYILVITNPKENKTIKFSK